VIDEREETDVAGRSTGRRDGRDVLSAPEDVRNRSTDQRERAIALFQPAA
jgi:hypothetical protein